VNLKNLKDMSEQDISMEMASPIDTNHPRHFIRQLLGYAIALLCLIWVFHDIHIERLWGQLGNITWGWVILGIVFDFFAYVCQGYRWRILLKPVGNISVVKTTQAIYCGLFTNEILPFRTGELIRAFLASRWMKARFVNIIPSIMVERFFDAIWLGIGVGITVFLVDLPKNLVHAADILGVLVLIFIAIFILLVIHKEWQLETSQNQVRHSSKIINIIGDTLNKLASGIKDIGTHSSFYFGLIVSPMFLICQIFALWFIMIGYGLNLNIWAGSAIMMILLLGIAIPNAPSNVGTYQFFTVIGLTLFGIDKTTATGFSVVAFIVLTLPLWIMGSIALIRTGMKLRDIRIEISKLIKR
jgi:uncharacterized protein (TIRG00374 family)